MKYRAGTYITNLSGDAAYQSFVLAPLPPSPPMNNYQPCMKKMKTKSKIKFDSLKMYYGFFYYLESNPIIDIKKTADVLGITFNTVSSAVKKFLELGILEQNGGTERYRTFTYAAYLDILKEGTE